MKYAGETIWDTFRTHNRANEIDVDDSHANSPHASITALTGTSRFDPSHAAAAGQLRRGASSVSA
jgi:hypothetical protein